MSLSDTSRKLKTLVPAVAPLVVGVGMRKMWKRTRYGRHAASVPNPTGDTPPNYTQCEPKHLIIVESSILTLDALELTKKMIEFEKYVKSGAEVICIERHGLGGLMETVLARKKTWKTISLLFHGKVEGSETENTISVFGTMLTANSDLMKYDPKVRTAKALLAGLYGQATEGLYLYGCNLGESDALKLVCCELTSAEGLMDANNPNNPNRGIYLSRNITGMGGDWEMEWGSSCGYMENELKYKDYRCHYLNLFDDVGMVEDKFDIKLYGVEGGAIKLDGLKKIKEHINMLYSTGSKKNKEFSKALIENLIENFENQLKNSDRNLRECNATLEVMNTQLKAARAEAKSAAQNKQTSIEELKIEQQRSLALLEHKLKIEQADGGAKAQKIEQMQQELSAANDATTAAQAAIAEARTQATDFNDEVGLLRSQLGSERKKAEVAATTLAECEAKLASMQRLNAENEVIMAQQLAAFAGAQSSNKELKDAVNKLMDLNRMAEARGTFTLPPPPSKVPKP